jgi:hypothetical protein
VALGVAAEHDEVVRDERRAGREGVAFGVAVGAVVEDVEDEFDGRVGARNVVLQVAEETPVAPVGLGQEADEQHVTLEVREAEQTLEQRQSQLDLGRRLFEPRADALGERVGRAPVSFARRVGLGPRLAVREEGRVEVGADLLFRDVDHAPEVRGLGRGKRPPPAEGLGADELVNPPQLVPEMLAARRVLPRLQLGHGRRRRQAERRRRCRRRGLVPARVGRVLRRLRRRLFLAPLTTSEKRHHAPRRLNLTRPPSSHGTRSNSDR